MNSSNSREESISTFPHSSTNGLQIQQQSFQFSMFSLSLQVSFQNIMREPEEYLERLLSSDEDLVFPDSDPETYAIVSEAKKRFKESAFNIIKSMKKDTEAKIYLATDSFLRQTVEDVKQQLFLSYKNMIQSLAKYLKENRNIEQVPIKPIPGITRPKLKPGKTKFPKVAKNILKSWYESHKEDPFPSHEEKLRLAEESGVTLKQVKCWFINMRRKRWNKEEDKNFSKQIKSKLVTGTENAEVLS